MNKKTLFALLFIGANTFAYDGYVNTVGCPVTEVKVSNIDNAWGWGGHFSTASSTDGWGGYYAECHLTSSDTAAQPGSVTVQCYDGYTSDSDHVDQYRLDLGPRKQLEQVVFKVTERGVAVEAVRHSESGYTSDENPYVVSTFFPLGESAGFCRESRIYYQANGNLANRSGRYGGGYTIDVENIN